jgi:hypothetical protein
MKKSQRSSASKRSSKLKDILVLIIGLIVILGIAHFPDEGKKLFTNIYATFVGDNTEGIGKNREIYRKVTNATDPSYLFLVDKLKSAGLLEINIDELSVHKFTDSAFKYRWKRGDQERTWEVYKDQSESWVLNEVPPGVSSADY